MITNLTEQQIERGREFLKDLRSNEKKATKYMRNSDGGRCCLCVAYDTAQRLGADLPKKYEDDDGLPPSEIKSFYGWINKNPILNGYPASAWNDGSNGIEKTHKEIADLFEEEFPQLKLS